MSDQIRATKDYSPKPITPEDKSYREVMMLFSDHPVKPKYWFEEFGEYWTCSCGQINRGDACSNCGLDRELLRKLFTSDFKDEDATKANTPEGSSRTDGEQAGSVAFVEETTDPVDDNQDEEPVFVDEQDLLKLRKRRTRRILIILIILILLLGGGLAAFYFYYLPELNRQDEAQANTVKDSLIRELPTVLTPMEEVEFDSYRNAGDIMYEKKDYVKAIEYYNKALKVKSDESVKKKIQAAKFSYVSDNQEEGGKTFNKYLNELKKANYPGINDIYERHYTWKASTVANTGYSDYSTDMSSIDRRNIVYFHTTFTGGPPDEELDLYYEVIWPDGTSERRSISGTKSEGETVTTNCQYTFPATAGESRLTYKIYNNADHKMLSSDSVTLL